MQNLKKALTKDDVKKYQKRNMTTSFAKKAKWQDIDQLMDQKSSKRQKNLVHQQLYTLISQAHQSGQLKDWPKLLSKLQQKYLEHHLDQDVKHDRIPLLEHIRDVIKSLQENENSIVVKKYLENCLQKIEFEIIQESKINKEASLLEFEKLLRVISKSTDKKKKPKITLGTSVSGGNLKIRFTREQYEIKNELKNKKSEGNIGSISSNSLRRQKSEDCKSKLQNFLKDNSVKMIKTKVSYDYSAILDASKAKIQKRNNKTANPDTQKQKLHKMSNANKKNDAFIFYRPKK